MKHLLTLAALLVSTLSLGQQMPYNPDANGDDFVGVDDVLGVLGVYDTALLQPDLQCDYEGTELEQLFIGISDGTRVLDSVYVEYSLLDTIYYFAPGCPDAIAQPTLLERAYMTHALPPPNFGPDAVASRCASYLFGFTRFVTLVYRSNYNYFELVVQDNEVSETFSSIYGSASQYINPQTGADLFLPFDDDFALTADGIEGVFFPDQWAANCQSFRLIPFWHEAE